MSTPCTSPAFIILPMNLFVVNHELILSMDISVCKFRWIFSTNEFVSTHD